MSTNKQLQVFIAQLNTIVGDLPGNIAKAKQVYQLALWQKADIVLLPELFICGYSPKDLLLKPSFLKNCFAAVTELAELTKGQPTAILMGAPLKVGDKLYNTVVLLADGKVQTYSTKVDLPNYKEFEELRVFSPGLTVAPISYKGFSLGLPICEDIWFADGACEILNSQGAELFLVANASPYSIDKLQKRHKIVADWAQQTKKPMVYLNNIGGQDELVFDGASFIYDENSQLALQLPQFMESNALICFEKQVDGGVKIAQVTAFAHDNRQISPVSALLSPEEEIYTACLLGLRDYVGKNGFSQVLLGLSGGLDSAICAALACDALGADKVHCYILPYIYTSKQSIIDAELCAAKLGAKVDTVEINQVVSATENALANIFAGCKPDVTEENMQSRVRGLLLMALSNKFSGLLLTTGNKSELAVGYCTLYGDMNGGFNPIKDLYKTQLYELAAWRNKNKPSISYCDKIDIIPENIIVKAPSAELRPDQKDEDSLPPYEILDKILFFMVEEDLSVADIVAKGYDQATVARVEALLYVAEYKRYQSAPGTKISKNAFVTDRHYPLTNKYRDLIN